MIKHLSCLLFVLLHGLLPAQEMAGWKSYIADSSASFGHYRQMSSCFVIHSEAELAASDLKNRGLTAVRRLDRRTYIVRQPADSMSLFGISIWRANNLWKLSDEIFLLDSIGTYRFLVKIISTDMMNYLSLFGKATEIRLSQGIILLETRKEYLLQIIRQEAVRFISMESQAPVPESRVLDLNLNPNRINKIHHAFPNLTGNGMIISIQEEQYDPDDLDLLGRNVVSDLASETVGPHATDMATIIAGAGNTFVTGRGVAKGAGITSSDFSDVLPDEQDAYTSLNVYLQNHSYGTQIENFYGIQAQAFDRSAFDNPKLLHVVSSGNQGMQTSLQGPYSTVNGYANLTGNFKMAKNTLSVGAVDTVGSALAFSSRGPAYDGRVKPELVAYSMVGSSNAAALVSGTAALLQQAYQDQYGDYPASALLKALLIAGADDTDTPGPDYRTGYGSLNAWTAMHFLKNKRFVSEAVADGEHFSYELLIPENTANLEVTLAWTDPPANPGDAFSLVNDLDLMLTDPGGSVFEPWVLDISPDSTALGKPAWRGSDHINTVEQITLGETLPGSYTISVAGTDLLTDKQPFHLVYSWDTLQTFSWDYPTGGDNFPFNGETATYFRWKSTFGPVHGRLEYRLLKDGQWKLIEDQVNLDVGHFRWEIFPEEHATAQARMIVGSEIFNTEAFTLSSSPNVLVGFNCGDSLLLQWKKEKNTDHYQVYQPGEKYLELLTEVSDTFLLLHQSAINDVRFSIQPVSQEGAVYLPSHTFDYTQQGGGCFLSSFYQEVDGDSGIYLNLVLGTTYGISKLLFERKIGDRYRIVKELVRPDQTQIRVLDSDPVQGHNVHRVTIFFANGEQMVQEATNTYYLTEKPVLIFPNPIFKKNELNVYTREFGSENVTFQLFDRGGALVLSRRMVTTQEAIPLRDLSGGLYFYRVQVGKNTFDGKLIVR